MKWTILGWYLCLIGCTVDQKSDLTIAVAANMQFAMEELIDRFNEKSGLHCEAVVSSSGKLTAQILKGAPFDILLSADLKYPDKLYQAGLTTDAPRVYGNGRLVLWTKVEQAALSFDLLSQPNITHIALPNPKTAPYGKAAQQVLKHYELLDSLQEKLVFAESISQANQFVVSGAAEVGFTSMSVVLSSALQGQGTWIEIDPEIYTPLSQGVVVIKNANSAKSEQFVDFLFSPDGKKILAKYGLVN